MTEGTNYLANPGGVLAEHLPPGRWKKCACVLINHDNPEDFSDRCIAWTNVDQPFCDMCERNHQQEGHVRYGFTRTPFELLAQEEPVVVSANEEQP